MPSSPDKVSLAKVQLLQCVQDLGKRAEEVGEPNIAVVLYCLYAAGMTGVDNQLSIWNEAFAHAQIKILAGEAKNIADNLDNPENPDKV